MILYVITTNITIALNNFLYTYINNEILSALNKCIITSASNNISTLLLVFIVFINRFKRVYIHSI